MFASDNSGNVPYPSSMPMEMRRYWDAPAWQSNSVSRFNVIDCIGEGAYSEVHKAKDVVNGNIVALKQLKRSFDGFPLTAQREIQVLQTLRHENIISLLGVVSGNTFHTIPHTNVYKFPLYQHIKCAEQGDTYLIFEYCATDLDVVNNGIYPICEVQAKYFMRQLMSVQAYLQHRNIVHRDIKPSNILIDNHGILKLADFNLAKKQSKDMTVEVVTRYYRAPEVLLLGSRDVYNAEKAKGAVHSVDYTYKIDVWAAGVILAEMLTHQRVLMKGSSDIDQYQSMVNICGEPTEHTYPGVNLFALMKQMLHKREQLGVILEPIKNRLREYLQERNVPNEAISLLEHILVINPTDRIDAQQAINDIYFQNTINPYQWNEQFGQMFNVWLTDKKLVPNTHNIEKKLQKDRKEYNRIHNDATEIHTNVTEQQPKRRKVDIPVREIVRAPPPPKEEETLDYGL